MAVPWKYVVEVQTLCYEALYLLDVLNEDLVNPSFWIRLLVENVCARTDFQDTPGSVTRDCCKLLSDVSLQRVEVPSF